jgi:DNA-binding Xre family transcriptional regulator
MTQTAKRPSASRKTYLLSRTPSRSRTFAVLKPEVVSSMKSLRSSLAHPEKNSLWISYDKELTAALLKHVSWTCAPLGEAVFVHAVPPESLPALQSLFEHFAFSVSGNFLEPAELAEALQADERADLFIGGSVDRATETITLWRGNLDTLTVPFSAFEESGDGVQPDFGKFSLIDYGQTVRLGKYEAAADALLYEFDPEYRRRIKKERLESEQTFGASLRRLRKERGLAREDFEPAINAKTVARIEQGKVNRIQSKTLTALAERLGVSPEEIETF